MIRTWLCQHLPWHRCVIEKRVSDQSSKLTCSCGRQYAVNHVMGVILPWDDDFAEMYARFDRRQAAMSRSPQDKATP